MSERIHVLAQQVLGKTSLDECDLQEIREVVNRYPYFAPAQFLLLEKLKKSNSSEHTIQLQKAVLYYHDPLQFEYFISSDRFETDINFEEDLQPSVPGDREEKVEVQEVPPDFPSDITEPTLEESSLSLPQPESDVASEEEMSLQEEEKITESIDRVLQKEEAEIKEPPPPADNVPVFEPYHTVDYFASQGIKLSQEEIPKDKFGKQLKSFTEWLKTMKRLPATEISKSIDASSESKVQHLAEDSVHKADVVTEAMAEVWIKQGNREKAIETYNKLGLLNPSKKAYFAALIENLKRS